MNEPCEPRPHAPDLAVALQEAHDVYALIAKEPVRGTLLKVGVAPQAIDNLRKAINATRIAQSQWVVVRDNRKDEAQRAREQAGYKLRSLLVAACRWNLRSHRVAMATLQGILEGAGVADLIQDLNDLWPSCVTRHLAGLTLENHVHPAGPQE